MGQDGAGGMEDSHWCVQAIAAIGRHGGSQRKKTCMKEDVGDRESWEKNQALRRQLL